MTRLLASVLFSVAMLSVGPSIAAERSEDAAWKERVSQLAKPAADEIVLTAVGDAIWNRPVSDDTDVSLQSLFEVLRASDIGFFNFEQTIIPDNGYPINWAPAGADPSILKEFQWAGATLVSLGNNHQWDYGLLGLEATRRDLESAGITFAGAGHNMAEAFKPAFLEKKGLKIALVSALVSPELVGWHPATADGGGTAQIRGAATRNPDGSVALSPFDSDVKAMEAAIAEARKNADVVAVSLHFHWGTAEAIDPGGKQLITHAAIDAGADIILGHGPHVVNGIELYKGKPIVYSLGNFFFQQVLSEYRFFPQSVKILIPMLKDPKQHESMALRLIMSSKGEFRRMELLPVDLKTEGTPRFSADTSAGETLERVAALSKPFGTKIKREHWYSVVELPKAK